MPGVGSVLASAHLTLQDLLTEERRLSERLRALQLDMYVMVGDGNCQVSSQRGS